MNVINNMDHMRISGNEPSLENMNMNQTKTFKRWRVMFKKVPKQAEAKGIVE